MTEPILVAKNTEGEFHLLTNMANRHGVITGATGTGLLGAVLFEAVAPGAAVLSLSGSATGPGGTPMGLQFRPVGVTIQP